MPNNSSARRDKDKKNKDKKNKDNKKTGTPPLLKEDTASADSNSLSLSFEEKEEQNSSLAVDRMEKAIQENPNAVLDKQSEWSWIRTVLLVEYNQATTIDERTAMRRKFRAELQESKQLASSAETKSHIDISMLRAAIDWRRREPQRKKDLLLSSALAEMIKEDELLVRGPAQDALLKEHALTLTMEDNNSNLYAEVREANPNAAAKELGRALRALRVQAALVWHKNRGHEGKDSSLPLPGANKLIGPPSLEAQQKSDASKYG
jgi:hypothetical protein